MARDSSTVRVAYLGDASQLARESQRASKSVAGVGTSADAMGRKLGRAFGAGAAAAAVAGVALAKNAISAASDLNESLSKNQAVFGASAKAVQAWANDSTKNILLTRQAAIEGAATFGNLFTALGVGQQTAAGLSTKLVGLAGDLSSFNNVGTDEALVALRSGLLGEAEPLRKFGVQLSAARIEAEAFALGLAKPVKNAAAIQTAQIKVAAATANLAKVQKDHGKGSLAAAQAQDSLDRASAGLTKAMGGQKVELTAAQKAQAAYSIILKDTKTAQGDAARTSDGFANKTRILHKQIGDISATLGQQLLPYAARAAKYISNLITEMQNGTGDGGRLRDAMARLAGAARSLGDVLIPIVKFLAEHPRVFFTLAAGVVAFKVAAGVAAFRAGALGTALFGVAAGEAAATAAAGPATVAMTGLGTAAAAALAQVSLVLGAAGAFYALGRYAHQNPKGFTGSALRGNPVLDKVFGKPSGPAPKYLTDPGPEIPAYSVSELGSIGKEKAKTAAASAKALHDTQVRMAKQSQAATDKAMAAEKYAADQAEAVAKRKQAAADALQKATDAMRDALQTRLDTARSIRDNLVGAASIVREGVSWTAKDLLSRFRVTMDKVKRFQTAIQTLVRKGFDQSIVQQVAAGGVANLGTAVGLARASAAQVGQANSIQRQIEKSAGLAGSAVAGQLGLIQVNTKVMLNDREIATAVNRYNARARAGGSVLAT